MSMMPKELHAELTAIKTMVGIKAYVSLSLDADRYSEGIVYIAIYPFGICADQGHIHARADTFEDALVKIREEWNRHREQYCADATRKMALAIIRITHELGQCSDAALRDEFDAAEIASLGAGACSLADTMAGKGPFRIVKAAKANVA